MTRRLPGASASPTTFERSPFEVNTQYRDWASDAPRLAAISSFGFSGTNDSGFSNVLARDSSEPAEPAIASIAGVIAGTKSTKAASGLVCGGAA